MTRFSLSGDGEDDEGPSCPVLKRPRHLDYSPTSSEDNEPPQRQQEENDNYDLILDEDEYFYRPSPCYFHRSSEGEDHNIEGRGGGGGGEENSELNVDSISADSNVEDSPPLATDRDRSISVFLTDPDVLDCSICFDPLAIPVFQMVREGFPCLYVKVRDTAIACNHRIAFKMVCENGHIACSSCCSKLSNKCPSCSWPIGYNRCRAIEKVLESVKIECQNKQYGCKETVTYSKKKDHEKTCTYLPCSCPLTRCNFVSSPKELYAHFSSQHKDSAVLFDYNRNFTLTMDVSDRFLVLQERTDGVLFILKNENEVLGNLLSVGCIGRRSFRRFLYDMRAEYEGNSLRVESFTEYTQGQLGNLIPTVFLLIPPGFFSSSSQLKLDITIDDSYASPACSERSIAAA